MISTRVHGLIDYAVAVVFGVLAATPAIAPAVRRAFGTAGAYHAGYSLFTDYEGGLQPRLSMRRHLALDALGGAALCAAGLAMRNHPPRTRALLLAAGMAELAVIAVSSAAPVSGPGQGSGVVERLIGDASYDSGSSYPPLDTVKPFADDVFVVDSVLPGLLERVLPVRMTVIRLPGGELLLHSPTRFTQGLKQELEGLGRIRHLVAPNIAHWTFLQEWQRACPNATTWAAPGLRQRAQVRRSGLRLDHDLGDRAPPEWGNAVTLVMVPGGLGFREAALFHPATRTLVLTDLVLNLEQHKLPRVLRGIGHMFGVTAPDGMPPPYLRAIVKLRRQDAIRAASRLVALKPERVIFAHGQCFAANGTQALQRSLRWLLD